MDNDLSVEAKQTFQVVAFLATILVVGIHYKSDVPNLADPSFANWNELAQEFLWGGVARVAVPLFAFASGFFYFRSDDGSLASYRKKWSARVRTVAVPFFLIGSIAMSFWLIVRPMEGKSVDLSVPEFLMTWLLHPPAEQLWYLRDLMVLVTIAPVIRWCGATSWRRGVFVTTLATLWAVNWQLFPIVAGWHALHLETLLFFALGYAAVSHQDWIERAFSSPARLIVSGWVLWFSLIVVRICVRADFDIWYVTDYGLADLLFHQASIVVGSVTLFVTASRMRWQWVLRLSGGAFFVYLVHEFPLRAIAHRLSDSVMDHSYSCWTLTPTVLIVCFAGSVLLSRFAPTVIAVLTGGRMPSVSKSAVTPSRIMSS